MANALQAPLLPNPVHFFLSKQLIFFQLGVCRIRIKKKNDNKYAEDELVSKEDENSAKNHKLIPPKEKATKKAISPKFQENTSNPVDFSKIGQLLEKYPSTLPQTKIFSDKTNLMECDEASSNSCYIINSTNHRKKTNLRSDDPQTANKEKAPKTNADDKKTTVLKQKPKKKKEEIKGNTPHYQEDVVEITPKPGTNKENIKPKKAPKKMLKEKKPHNRKNHESSIPFNFSHFILE